jgi:hypothetical protein
MTFGTLLWESVILARDALLLRDIAGIGSAPPYGQLLQFFYYYESEKTGVSGTTHSFLNGPESTVISPTA